MTEPRCPHVVNRGEYHFPRTVVCGKRIKHDGLCGVHLRSKTLHANRVARRRQLTERVPNALIDIERMVKKLDTLKITLDERKLLHCALIKLDHLEYAQYLLTTERLTP